jgi:hypothetical protein
MFVIATGVAIVSFGQTTRANQEPLSGRTGQSGSVTATESPVPGTTTSVNTINPTVQVEGPYAGSAAGKTPFSGQLSLRDAVNRGLNTISEPSESHKQSGKPMVKAE